MAKRSETIKGITIELNGDTTKLTAALKQTTSQIISTQDQLKDVNRLLKLDPSNTELLAQKQRYLANQIANTKDKLSMLREAEKQVQQQIAEGKASQEQYDALQREIVQTENNLRNLQQSAENNTNAIDRLGDESSQTAEDVDQLGGSFEKANISMVTAVASADTLVAGLVSIGNAAIDASSEFESAFAKTQTIMDTASLSVEEMHGKILGLSSDSGMAAANVSEAVYQAISGSVATRDAARFVEDANKLAVAGFTSLTSATDVLTTALNSYKLGAEQVTGISNVLIRTQNLGKTSMDELANSMGRAISEGSAYGVNLQNIAASYVELTRGGIATAEATTYLSGMLNELGDSGSKVGGILQERTGKSFGQLMQSGWSLADVLQILSDHVNGNAEALMGLWSSQEAGKASNAILTQGLEDFNSVLSQMDKEMQGATGATQNAYKTMTQTSAFIEQRFQNSVDNLKIAFGDELAPAVDQIRSKLTVALESLTGFIQDSPLASAAFAGLTTGAGVLAAALTVMTAKTLLADTAVGKLTMTMLSNPYLLVAAGISGLIGTVFALSAAADDGAESFADMTAAAQNLKTAVSDSEASYAEARASLDASKELAGQYVDRLKELETQSSMTAGEQMEYADTVEKLRTLVPDLNLELNEQTGMLKEGAAALEAQIGDWYELAVAQALQDKYKQQIEAQAQAEAKVIALEQKRAALEEQRGAIAARIEEINLRKNAILERQAQLEREIAKAEIAGDDNRLQKLNEEMMQLDNETVQLGNDLNDLWVDSENLNLQIDNTNGAIDETNATLEDNRYALDEAKDAYLGYTDAVRSGAEELTGYAKEAVTAWSEAAAALQEAYDSAWSDARATADKAYGLLEDLSETMEGIGSASAASASEAAAATISAWGSQADFWNSYAANMQAAVERGVNEGLLAQLSDGTEESAVLLAQLAQMTDEEIENVNASFAKVQEGKDNFADSVAEYTGAVETETQAMVDLAKQAGADMSGEMTNELLNGLPAFMTAWRRYRAAASGSQGTARAPQMEAYASGTFSAAEGLALVGEKGPEIVYFQGGERVLTAEQTRQALAASQTVSGLMTEYEKLFSEVFKQLSRVQQTIASADLPARNGLGSQALPVALSRLSNAIDRLEMHQGNSLNALPTINIYVNGVNFQDADALADVIMDKIQESVRQQQEVFR